MGGGGGSGGGGLEAWEVSMVGRGRPADGHGRTSASVPACQSYQSFARVPGSQSGVSGASKLAASPLSTSEPQNTASHPASHPSPSPKPATQARHPPNCSDRTFLPPTPFPLPLPWSVLMANNNRLLWQCGYLVDLSPPAARALSDGGLLPARSLPHCQSVRAGCEQGVQLVS